MLQVKYIFTIDKVRFFNEKKSKTAEAQFKRHADEAHASEKETNTLARINYCYQWTSIYMPICIAYSNIDDHLRHAY